tara:strand:- start:189 stop:584 length:396 start_codon:yes stop_codon:yes gene_type:complete
MENIYKNFFKFFVVGCIAFSSDILLYFFLVNIGWLTYIAKGAGFIFGLIIGFFLNSIFTFNNASISNKRFFKYLLIYLISLLANTSVNEFLLSFLYLSAYYEQAFWIAVIIATVVSMLMNFIGLRYYVYKN